jgi:tRNA C32,U32 (ribose-2'-O)-methylase TrmJ
MVIEVLNKEYVQESCMAILTDIRFAALPANSPMAIGFGEVRRLCIALVSQSLAKLVGEATFGPDDTSARIRAWLNANSTAEQRLTKWLTDKGFRLGVTAFLFGRENASLRREAIKTLDIP